MILPFTDLSTQWAYYGAQRTQYKVAYKDSLCYRWAAYFIAIIVIPGMLLANIAIYGDSSALRTRMDNSIDLECDNAMKSILGYLIIYAIYTAWLLGLMLVSLKSCEKAVREGPACCSISRTIFMVCGAIIFLGLIVFNLAVSYWGTEANFITECSDISPALYAMVIANIVIAHIVFDLMCFATVPRAIRAYQWL